MARFESWLRKDASSRAQTRRNVVSYPQTIQESLRSTHRLALLEPEKFHRVCQAKQRMHPTGCMSLSWATQGFLRASTGTWEKSVPSFFARDRKEGTGRTSGKNRHSRKRYGRVSRATARASRPYGEPPSRRLLGQRASRPLRVRPLARTLSRDAKGYAES